MTVRLKKFRRFSLLALASTLLITIFAGCKKDKNEEPVKAGPVTTKQTYKYYEFGGINYPTNAEPGTIVMATLNGKETKLAVADDSTLAFTVVPDPYTTGSNTLQFTLNNEPLSVTFDVEAAAEASNPEQTFTDHKVYLQNQLDVLATLGATDTTGNFNRPEMVEAMEAASLAIAQMNAMWGTMDPADKQLLANVLAVNEPMYREMTETMADIASYLYTYDHGMAKLITICNTGTPLEKYACVAGHIVLELATLIKKVSLSTFAIVALPFRFVTVIEYWKQNIPQAVVALTNVVYLSYQFVRIHVRIVKASFWAVVENAGSKTTLDRIEFSKNAEVAMPVSINLSRVTDKDGSFTTALFNNVVGKIAAYNALCDKYSILFSKFKIKFAEPSVINSSIFSLSHLSVSGITNSAVQFVSIGGTTQSPTVRFTTQENTDQEFSFNITYNDGLNKPVTAKIDGKLVAGDRLDMLTKQNWTLSSIFETWFQNGSNQSAEVIKGCEADDDYKFSPDFALAIYTGLLTCDSAPPSTNYSTWGFTANQTKLVMQGVTFDILSLGENILKVQRIYDDGGGLMVNQTLTFTR